MDDKMKAMIFFLVLFVVLGNTLSYLVIGAL